jgi:hypothetical protein
MHKIHTVLKQDGLEISLVENNSIGDRHYGERCYYFEHRDSNGNLLKAGLLPVDGLR